MTTGGIAALALACEATIAWRVECMPDTGERRAAFVLECTAAGNPYSDEEGEDLVEQCALTARGLFCGEVPIACHNGDCTPCRLVTDAERVAACRAAGALQPEASP